MLIHEADKRETLSIILARHTREGAYQQAFQLLKKRFRRWDDLLDAPAREVAVARL